MSGSSKGKKKHLWYGYLEAGASSTPVLRDDRLNTGNPRTLYLFNLARGRILEYSREIVEGKLCELNGKQSKAIADLDAGYAEARRDFKQRSARLLNIPERASSAGRATQEADLGETADDESPDNRLDAQVE